VASDEDFHDFVDVNLPISLCFYNGPSRHGRTLRSYNPRGRPTSTEGALHDNGTADGVNEADHGVETTGGRGIDESQDRVRS
jgi:hypothetical protein